MITLGLMVSHKKRVLFNKYSTLQKQALIIASFPNILLKMGSDFIAVGGLIKLGAIREIINATFRFFILQMSNTVLMLLLRMSIL